MSMAAKQRWGLFLFTFLFFGLFFSVADGKVRVEKYTNKADFIERLGGAPFVSVVNFDDIDTSVEDPAPFDADRYLDSHGIIITGEDGQYVSRDFGSPSDFAPASWPNMYAPGPIDLWSTSGWAGGNYTDVTFSKDGLGASTAGFGVSFIDADWPEDGPSSFAIYDNAGNELGRSGTVTTLNLKKRFVGLVTVDKTTGRPIAAISRVNIINGSGWPGNDYNEGVGLDNFVFKKPVVTPVPTSVNPPQGTVGTVITIGGSNFGTAGKVLVGGFAAEVLDWQEDVIVCRLTTTPKLPGSYRIEIQTKGKSYAVLSNAFSIEPPQNLLLAPDHGVGRDRITATGSFFGTKLKKVLMGTTECTVLSWDMDPVTGDSQIVFKVPVGLKSGTYEVKVVMRVGVATAPFTID